MGRKLNFQKVVWGSAAYALTVALRYDMLREPLGLHFNLTDLDYEQDSVHWAGFSEEGEVLACLVLRPASTASVLPEPYCIEEAYQMRQVAVKPSYQGLGLGRALVLHSQNWLRDQDKARLVFLHARPQAVGFYQRLGYQAYHEPFMEVGLLHTRMFMDLQSPF
ncbi:MAG: GNAT family N-acetyltransferase [Sphingomonadales bacterium]|nr:GNAT family N-acetyltransferase [Sphingomonadales bacterium]MBM3924111.1 GNAT family N-acetyltransferase [Sphingomonadales bacterium]MBM3931316.1 GNAT family N-acetyltransferase [Sphingomonadales bacterium]